MDLLLLFWALLGHAFLWIGLINRLHSVGLRRSIIHLLTMTLFFLAGVIPLGIAAWVYVRSPAGLRIAPWRAGGSVAGVAIAVYTAVCWIVAPMTLLRLVWLRWLVRRPAQVRFHGQRRAAIDPRSSRFPATETSHHLFSRLPPNEILRPELSDWMLDMPRLPPALDGLSIVHLSDFHLTGRIGKAYFREVVRTSNELQPDLVALTGDLVESKACFDWIPDTFGQLRARCGVYFVLGNHDLRTRDVPRLRQMLEHSGLVDLGGRRRQIEVDGQPVVLMGTERPWIKNAPVAACGFATDAALRIVLSHSPDQLAWARSQGADLMLAGHTHGGQICIPPLGAIFSPSAWGVKHVAGVYYSPPTILHVSRGISGDTPIRWRCPPEITRLRLFSAKGAAAGVAV